MLDSSENIQGSKFTFKIFLPFQLATFLIIIVWNVDYKENYSMVFNSS